MAGADQDGAVKSNGFEGKAQGGQGARGLGGMVGAVAIDINQGVAGFVVEADADQLLGVLPQIPQDAGA